MNAHAISGLGLFRAGGTPSLGCRLARYGINSLEAIANTSAVTFLRAKFSPDDVLTLHQLKDNESLRRDGVIFGGIPGMPDMSDSEACLRALRIMRQNTQ
jgi:hypothetical protein